MALDAALGLPGSRPGAVTSLTRPTNPFQGQVIVETDTNTVLFYTTNGWRQLAILKSAPATSVGVAGDSAGMIAYNSSYFYVCTADYDGTTAIWKRIALTTW